MRDEKKTKQQLIVELMNLRKQVARLEISENKLKLAEEKYKQLLNDMGDGYIAVQKGRIVFANRQFGDIFGYEPEQVISKPLEDFVLPAFRQERKKLYEKVVYGGEAIPGLHSSIVNRVDGTQIVIESKSKLIQYEGESAICVIVRDITEHKQTDRNYRQLLEVMSDGYAVIEEGKIVFANRRIDEIFGYEPGQLPGEILFDFLGIGDYRSATEHYQKTVRDEYASDEPRESVVVKKDGTEIIIESSIKSVKNEGGVALCVIVRDITKRKRAQEELIAAQKYARNLIDRSLDMIISVDRERRIVEFNQAAQKTFGYSKEEVLGKHVSMLYTNPDQGFQALEVVRETGQFTGEIINKRKNGETFISYLAASPLFNERGEFLGTMGVSRDITERKRMEERIRYRLKVEEALERVSRLFATQRDVDLSEVLRILGEVVSVNRAYIFQLRRDREKRDNICEWCSPGTKPQIHNLQSLDSLQFSSWMNAFSCGDSVIIPDVDVLPGELMLEKRVLQSQGIRSLLMVPICKTDGELTGVIGFDDTESCRQWSGEDVSLLRVAAEMLANYWERKRAEAVLRDSEEKLRLIFESVPEGIIVCDLRGAIIDLNNGAIHMLAYDNKEELIGRKGLDLVAESDYGRAGEDIKKTLETGSIGVSQYTLRRKDGSEFPAAWSAAVLRDPDCRPAGFVFIAMDTTEQQKMQEQLMLADRLASIGQLTSGIAHELNNPLTSVIGFSELLLEKKFSDDVREDLETIDREAKRAADVVKGLLTFVRKQGTEKLLIDVNGIIREVLQLRSYEQKVSKIKVEANLAPDLPQITGNGAQMQQVFVNLIVNAEQSMREAHDRGILRVTTLSCGDMIRISIDDDGPGISPEDMKSLFTPFFTTKEVGKGTGLGLSICHGIVTEHGGRIFAESEPGFGATFVVELPVSENSGDSGESGLCVY